VAIQVKDAETDAPIAGARVCISYPLAADPGLAPWDWVEMTGSDGIARLRAAPCGEIAIRADVNASGYMSEEKYLPVESVRAIEPAHLFEDVDRRPVNVVLQMYAEPAPTVELVLPADLRGLIKAEIKIQDDAVWQPGQRLFSYQVPSNGIVEITGPALLRRVLPATFCARRADGTPLTRQPVKSALGFWWVKHDGNHDCFFVGTQAEFDRYYRSPAAQDAGEQHVHGGGDGSGGRRNRRGGQAHADTSADGN